MHKTTVIFLACMATAIQLSAGDKGFAPQNQMDCSVFMKKVEMTMKPDGSRHVSQQGMAAYGKYLFCLEDKGGVMVYDFKKRDGKSIGHFSLATAQDCQHANSCNWGVEKKKGASFPLLYITTGKNNCDLEWRCCVESITLKNGVCSSELAQTITLDTLGFTKAGLTRIWGCPAWEVDKEQNCIWIFSAIKRTKLAQTGDFSNNKYVAYKVRLPKLSEGASVTLGVNDIQKQCLFEFDAYATQGGCARDGKIFFSYGFGKREKDPLSYSKIRVYDTATGEIVSRYDLRDEMPEELEDIFIQGKWMYVNTNGENIYRLRISR